VIIIIIESELNLQSCCLELCQPRPTGHGSSASAGPRRRSPLPLRPWSRRDHRGHPCPGPAAAAPSVTAMHGLNVTGPAVSDLPPARPGESG
jgi:hypothetical protein